VVYVLWIADTRRALVKNRDENRTMQLTDAVVMIMI